MRDEDSQHVLLAPKGENELADKIREALGASDEEDIEVVTPQFIRPEGEPGPAYAQRDRQWWENLRTLGQGALKEMGCGQWNDPKDDDFFQREVGEGMVLMLFPGEWYSTIPAGYEVVDICGERENFEPGKTDDDIRFGVLPYGVLVKG